ncbi:MAG: ATP-binding protein, partial [Acidimicrobiales bacterium]
DDALADHVVAVLREALANVARHARATSAQLAIAVAGDRLVVQLTDDGVGVGDSDRGGGRGLANMHARADKLGGTVTIAAAPGGGTIVAFEAPIR